MGQLSQGSGMSGNTVRVTAALFDGVLFRKCGVALGYPDNSANLSNVPTDRLEVPDFCQFQGFVTGAKLSKQDLRPILPR
eukprot:s6170_g10.t1